MFNEIDRIHGIEFSRDLLELHVELLVEEETESRCCTPSLGIPLEVSLSLDPANRLKPNRLSGVGDSRHRPEQDRNLEFLRQVEGDRHHMLGVPRTGGVKNGNLCEHSHESSVLLGLGRVGTWIITADDHESTDCSDVSRTHERICSHVQTDLFHSHGSAFSRVGSDECIFQGDLLVGRPLDVGVEVVLPLELNHARQDF